MAPQKGNRVKVYVLLRAGHKVSEIANFVGVSRTSAYAIKKLWTMAKVSIGVQTVVEKLLWIVITCGMPFEGLLRIIQKPDNNCQTNRGQILRELKVP